MRRVLLAVAAMCVVALVWASPALGQASGVLKVTSFPTGAAIEVDGVDTGKVTPASLSLPLGDHAVKVAIPAGGWNADTRTVTIAAGNNDLSVTLLPVITQGPPGPPGPPGSGALKVVDSLDQTVGYYYTAHRLLMPKDGRWYDFGVNADGFASQGPDPERYYETNANCTGVPYLWLRPAALFITAGRLGNLAYVPSLSTKTILVQCMSNSSISPTYCRCDQTPFYATVAEEVTFDVSTFVPPFRLSQ